MSDLIRGFVRQHLRVIVSVGVGALTLAGIMIYQASKRRRELEASRVEASSGEDTIDHGRAMLRQRSALDNTSDWVDGLMSGDDDTIVDQGEFVSIESLTTNGIKSLQQSRVIFIEIIRLLDEEDELSDEQVRMRRLLDVLVKKISVLLRQFESDSEINAMAMDLALSEVMAESKNNIQEFASDTESFVSATDLADLSDLDRLPELYANYPIYKDALLKLRSSEIHVRTLRTQQMQCMSDAEYIAKVECLRNALDSILSEPKRRKVIETRFRHIFSKLIRAGDGDVNKFETAYDRLLAFCRDEANLCTLAEELNSRGVISMNFYDIVVDFMVLDAFDDLKSPPPALTTVLTNQWLSEGFRRRAIDTGIWSLIKAKRSMLKNPNGFMNIFYDMCECVTPTLAWGFLGPVSEFQCYCNSFKSAIVASLVQIFDVGNFKTLDRLIGVVNVQINILMDKLDL